MKTLKEWAFAGWVLALFIGWLTVGGWIANGNGTTAFLYVALSFVSLVLYGAYQLKNHPPAVTWDDDDWHPH